MGDMAEDFKALKEILKERRKSRLSKLKDSYPSMKQSLSKYGLKVFTEWHWRAGDYDFWPTTGYFKNIKIGRNGRGFINLIKLVKE